MDMCTPSARQKRNPPQYLVDPEKDVDEEGKPEIDDISPNSPNAVAWCATGAFCAALDVRGEYNVHIGEGYLDFFQFLRKYHLRRIRW